MDIRFAYSGSQPRAIDGLTLDVRPGERIALVCENGTGKTTLVKLPLRLYDVQTGTVRAGGHDMRLYDPAEYQEHPLLAVSIADNVLGRSSTPGDAARVRDALEKVGLWEQVSRLPGASTRR